MDQSVAHQWKVVAGRASVRAHGWGTAGDELVGRKIPDPKEGRTARAEMELEVALKLAGVERVPTRDQSAPPAG